MARLSAELQRLYGLPADAGAAARAVVVGFARAADWPQVAALCRGLAEDLDLPPPALAVDGQSGFQVWLSFADPLPDAAVQAFLAALQRDYLAEVAAVALVLGAAEPPPAEQPAGDRWSAFIDPELGGMFIAEPWLDCAPNPDQQAELLAGLAGIRRGEFERALLRLTAAAPAPGAPSVGGSFADPKSFLLAVMNDPTATTEQRIAAATALLPYFG